MCIVLKGGAWRFQSIAAIGLASLLALPPQSNAQQQPGTLNPAGAPQPSQPAPLPTESLRIFVLEGQGLVNDIRTRTTSSPVVEVRDDNRIPVEGASVTFELPAVGPGGTFAGQVFTATVRTNSQGQATATFQPNMQTGRFEIKVSATRDNRSGHAVIRETNALHAAKVESKKGLFKFAWWKVALVGGVVALVVVLATRGGSSGQSVPLIPGTPTFGAP